DESIQELHRKGYTSYRRRFQLKMRIKYILKNIKRIPKRPPPIMKTNNELTTSTIQHLPLSTSYTPILRVAIGITSFNKCLVPMKWLNWMVNKLATRSKPVIDICAANNLTVGPMALSIQKVP
ncbi:11634_t:CDS:2, partial [Ambispora gerdemannii]